MAQDTAQRIWDRQWVCLRHILKATWDLGIPVIHLKNLPDEQEAGRADDDGG